MEKATREAMMWYMSSSKLSVSNIRALTAVPYPSSGQHKLLPPTPTSFTRPTKNRTATVLLRTASYCIHVLRIAILRLKLFAVENMPIRRSRSLPSGIGDDFNISRSKLFSKSSEVGKPLTMALATLKSPEILT